MTDWHRIAGHADLKRSGALAVTVGGTALALFEVDGRIVATQGLCPHAGGPLHKGSICAGKLSCPWHGWTYDLVSGACEESDEVSLARHDVRIEGDDIYVAV